MIYLQKAEFWHRMGFKKAWQERDYTTVIGVARKSPEDVLQEDPKLLMLVRPSADSDWRRRVTSACMPTIAFFLNGLAVLDPGRLRCRAFNGSLRGAIAKYLAFL